MPNVHREFSDEHFVLVDELLSVAFFPDVAVDGTAGEGRGVAELIRGPSFGVWTFRDGWQRDAPDDISMFNQKNVKSPFYFSQKHLHLMTLDSDAIAVMTTCAGRPLYAKVMGSREDLLVFFKQINQRFDDSYAARWIPAPRGQDALVVSHDEKSVFIPVVAGLGGELLEMNLDEYIQFARLAE